MVANKYAFLQITRRRFLNEWEAFTKVMSRRDIRRRITIPLPLSNLKLLRRITRTENLVIQPDAGRQVASVTGVESCVVFFSSRRRHTRSLCDWSSDVCSSDRSEEHTSELQSSRRRHTRSLCDWSSDVCSSDRSEEHTSELQSHSDLVCRLLL